MTPSPSQKTVASWPRTVLTGRRASLLKGNVYIDFRKEEDYFTSLFRLVVNLYDMSPRDAEVEALIKDMNVQV